MQARWQRRRVERQALALAAVEGDLVSGSRLLAAWSWSTHPEAVLELVARVRPADTVDTRRLEAWAWAHAEGSLEGTTEAELDRQVLEDVEPASSPSQAGGLVWLARVGEEVRRREDRAWRDVTYGADPRDAPAADLWRELLTGDFGPDAPRNFVRLFGGPVRRAFKGVCDSLRLPPEVVRVRVEEAFEMADGLAWAAPGDLAARVLETVGEPLGALSTALESDSLGRVRTCVRHRRLWRDLEPLLSDEVRGETLGVGADLVVTSRLLVALEAGRVPFHPLGLPGWGVVRANRGRLRGRLRAVLAEHPLALAEALSGLDGLARRTDDAISRHAWAWAWREARTGFGFDPGRLRAPPCAPEATGASMLEPLGPDDESAVLTLLLSLAGRGQWTALEAWLSGAAGRSLGATFYRYLGQAPDCVADPGTEERGNRGYQRLREHLQDEGLQRYLPQLKRVAQRVRAVPRGRGLRERLWNALEPDWRADLMDLPRRGVENICDNLVAVGCPQ